MIISSKRSTKIVELHTDKRERPAKLNKGNFCIKIQYKAFKTHDSDDPAQLHKFSSRVKCLKNSWEPIQAFLYFPMLVLYKAQSPYPLQ